MPSLYQILPRLEQHPVLNAKGDPLDVYDAGTWVYRGWGMIGAAHDDELITLLPGAPSRHVRIDAAHAHLHACLAAAADVQEALDHDAEPLAGLRQYLYAGDGVVTVRQLTVAHDGSVDHTSFGDGVCTVLRSSALLDQRLHENRDTMLQSPIHWSLVAFVPTDHMMMTCHPTFINNVLFQLLEDATPHTPKAGPAGSGVL